MANEDFNCGVPGCDCLEDIPDDPHGTLSVVMEGGNLCIGIKSDPTTEEKFQRYLRLCDELNPYGLEPRLDSVLCKEWILEGNGNVWDITHTMIRMDFLHKHTRYRTLLRRANIHKSQFATLDEYAQATQPLQAVAAKNWCTRFRQPLYMIPDYKLRCEVYYRYFGNYEHLLWTPRR